MKGPRGLRNEGCYRAAVLRRICELAWSLSMCFAGCSPSVGAQATTTPAPPDPCAPGGRLRPPPGHIVATTTAPSGDLIDWISASSLTPDGTEASPPPPPPMPSDPIPPPPDAPPGTAGPVIGEVDMGPKGPPGTVPFVRPKLPRCDCFVGYVQQANGSCKAAGAAAADRER